jgi:hypothetical protein
LLDVEDDAGLLSLIHAIDYDFDNTGQRKHIDIFYILPNDLLFVNVIVAL